LFNHDVRPSVGNPLTSTTVTVAVCRSSVGAGERSEAQPVRAAQSSRASGFVMSHPTFRPIRVSVPASPASLSRNPTVTFVASVLITRR